LEFMPRPSGSIYISYAFIKLKLEILRIRHLFQKLNASISKMHKLCVKKRGCSLNMVTFSWCHPAAFCHALSNKWMKPVGRSQIVTMKHGKNLKHSNEEFILSTHPH
jgi:hypothetical protein